MSVEEIDALHREARRLGYQICLDQQWKGHMHQLSYVTAERDALAKRCTQLSTRVDQLTVEGERMGRAFDAAVELREFVEDSLGDRNAELVEELAQTQAMNTDLQRAEQEYESLIERATRDVFRILDHLGVRFDSSIALRTALDALKHRVMPDHTVEPIPNGELPFEAREGAKLLLQNIRRHGVGVMLDEAHLLGWWANIAMAGHDHHARKYSALLTAAIMPKQKGESPRGQCYSQRDEFAIAEAAEAHVDWSAPELQPRPFENLEEVPL
jgi:hypothetical protein